MKHQQAYLELFQASRMKVLEKKVGVLLTVNYIAKKAPPQMFDRILNTPLTCIFFFKLLIFQTTMHLVPIFMKETSCSLTRIEDFTTHRNAVL